jgi:ABC-type polysaccharide/polyol phosphate transport system ATPase subunit
MSDVVIRVENLGKRYRIGERERYLALRDVLTRAVSAPASLFGRKPSSPNGDHSHIWALKDVSFDIRQGDVVGIIGRNGAGKTTLLKILARVTKPTRGFAEVHGRIGTLLEVGTGFHPELTGRENVFLSGAILGMRKAEIRRKFDEIVDFAEVETFIDTPLKHYSTGMQMRLAFAVAAHLEPEILLVDEVLAVGDLAFQKKCLGKMGDVAKAGRTILFVSHQMNQIRRLCTRVLWVDAGGIRQDGSTPQVAASYESAIASSNWGATRASRGNQQLTSFRGWEILEPKSSAANLLISMGPVSLRFSLEVAAPVHMGRYGIALFSMDRQLVWAWATDNLELGPGTYDMTHSFPYLPLRPGPYCWQVSLWDHHGLVDLWDCLPELVIATETNQHHDDRWNGILNIPSTFSLSSDKERRIAADACI